MKTIVKPKADEYPAYASIYIDLVPDDGLVLKHLADNSVLNINLISSLSEEQLLFRYAKNKWTIKEILLHLIDDERIYVYRALRFARNDAKELPGFDQDDYVAYSNANKRSLASLLEEYRTTREATINFFDNLEDTDFAKSGIADGKRATVRALLYHITGHEMRHMNIIKERYLQ